MNSAIYVGTVTHRRMRPVGHQLRLPLCMFLIDLDELPALDRISPWLRVGRPA